MKLQKHKTLAIIVSLLLTAPVLCVPDEVLKMIQRDVHYFIERKLSNCPGNVDALFLAYLKQLFDAHILTGEECNQLLQCFTNAVNEEQFVQSLNKLAIKD